MNHPEGRAQQRDVLEQDALALVERDELRPQSILRAEDALRRAPSLFVVHGDAVLAVAEQSGAGLQLLADHALLPSVACGAAPWPPRVVAATAVDGAEASDGDVVSPEGIDAWRQVEALQSLPRRFDDGVELGLEGELEHGSLLDDEVDAALELDSAREELLSGRHDDASAALLRAAVDGLLDGLLVLGGRGRRLGAHLGDDVLGVLELRSLDALFNLLVELVVPLCHEAQWQHDGQCEQAVKSSHWLL